MSDMYHLYNVIGTGNGMVNDFLRKIKRAPSLLTLHENMQMASCIFYLTIEFRHKLPYCTVLYTPVTTVLCIVTLKRGTSISAIPPS